MSLFNTFKHIGKTLAVLKTTKGVIDMADSNGQSATPQDEHEETGKQKTLFEEIEVEGKQLVERVKQLLHEGNIRTLRVKDKNGKYLLEIPLSVGVVTGGVFLMSAPWITALSALAGFITDVKIEIIRDDEAPSEDEAEESD